MSAGQPKLIIAAALGLVTLVMIGCGDGMRLEDGPLPRIPAPNSLQRVRKLDGTGPGGIRVTYWLENGQLVHPSDRVAGLRNVIESGLHEDLAQMQMAQMPDGRTWERPSTTVAATVVSLTPDVAILSVGHIAVDSTVGPFDDWLSTKIMHNPPPEKAFEYVNSYNGNLWMSAGSIAPYADEMFAVSGDTDVPIQQIQWTDNKAEVEIQNADITLTRVGSDVRVEIEYR